MVGIIKHNVAIRAPVSEGVDGDPPQTLGGPGVAFRRELEVSLVTY